MGFNPAANVSQTFSAVAVPNSGNSIVSPNIINMTGPNYLYINSTRIGGQVDLYLPLGAAASDGSAGPQMAKVPVTCEPGGTIYWSDPDVNKWFNMHDLNALNGMELHSNERLPA